MGGEGGRGGEERKGRGGEEGEGRPMVVHVQHMLLSKCTHTDRDQAWHGGPLYRYPLLLLTYMELLHPVCLVVEQGFSLLNGLPPLLSLKLGLFNVNLHTLSLPVMRQS